MNKHHDLVPSVMFDDDSRARSEKSRGRARMTPAHSTQTSTDTAFIYFMHSAVAKIDKLIAYADKVPVLFYLFIYDREKRTEAGECSCTAMPE